MIRWLFFCLLFLQCAWGKDLKPSSPYFFAGIDARRSQVHAEKGCGHLSLPWRVFCLEGYYFQDAFQAWRFQPAIGNIWAFPLPSTTIQALSIGMALGYSGKPIPQSFLQLGHLTPYIVDGWAFILKIEHPQSSQSCWNGPWSAHHRPCAYGRGRAMFFIEDKNPADDGGSTASEGLAFARAYNGSDRKPSQKLTQLIEALHSPDKQTEKFKLCLEQDHYINCQDSL
jgi:hypothetical protein